MPQMTPQQVIQNMSEEDFSAYLALSDEDKIVHVSSLMNAGFDPNIDVSTPKAQIEAVQSGNLPAFRLPFGQPASFKSRLFASLASDSKGKVNILKRQGLDAHILPNNMVVILNDDGTVSPLDEQGLSVGDIADEGGSVLPAIGGSLGAMAGIPSTPLGMGGLAALGAFTGQGINELIASNLGALQAPDAAMENMLSEGILEGFFAFAPGAASPLIKNVSKSKTFGNHINPFLKTVNPVGIKARPLFQEVGADLPVTALNSHRVLQLIRTRGKMDNFAGEIWTTEEKAAKEALDKIVLNFSDDITKEVTPRAAGEFAKDGRSIAAKNFRTERDLRFNRLGEKMSGHRVFAPETVDRMRDIFRRSGIMDDNNVLVKKIDKLVSGKMGGLVEQYEKLIKPGATFTYNDLKILKTVINNAIPASKDNISKGVVADMRNAASAVSEDMLNNVKRVAQLTKDESLLREVVETNQWYARNLTLQNGSVASKINNSNPERIMDLIFKANNVTEIRELKELMTATPQYVNFLSRQWLDRVVRDHTDKAGDLVIPGFTKKIRRMGDDMLEEMYGDSFRPLKDILDAADILDQGFTGAGPALAGQNIIRQSIGMITHPFAIGLKTLSQRRMAKFLTSDAGKAFASGSNKIPNEMASTINKFLASAKKRAPAVADRLQNAGTVGPLFSQIFSAQDKNQLPPR